LNKITLDPEAVEATLGVVLKYEDDIARLDADKVRELIGDVEGDLAGPV
jgi:hypothetical protein